MTGYLVNKSISMKTNYYANQLFQGAIEKETSIIK